MEKLRKITSKKQFRFVLVGGAATIIDFGLLNLFNQIGWDSLVANTISTGLAMAFSFFANKKFTFQSDSKNYARQITLFIIFTLIGLWVIQNLIIQGLLLVLPTDWPDWLRLNGAKVLATVASMTWNYITYNKIVFKSDNSKQTRN
jgi:putative flippase GtrA